MITPVSKYVNLFRNQTINAALDEIARKSVKSNKIGTIPKTKKPPAQRQVATN
jgi:hypothetical protein